LAHGNAPPVLITIGAVMLAARCCWWPSTRRLSAGRLLCIVASVQVVLHVTFAVTTPLPTAHAGHQVAGPAAAVGHGGGRMLLAHLLAALVLVGWLHSGERLLWRAARSTVRGARRVIARLWPPGGAAADAVITHSSATRPRTTASPSLILLGHSVVRRGPPTLIPG
jgi:hypothetical protein